MNVAMSLCRLAALTSFILLAIALHAPKSQAAEPAWPQVRQVDAQPLLLQVQRLSEALDFIGRPLDGETQQALAALRNESDDAIVVAKVQQLLDPHCITAISIDDGKLTTSRPGLPVPVTNGGWTNHLVKVCNAMGVRSHLTVTSPNARPLPHSPPEKVASRWLGLSMFDGRPMQPDLSGLELEYRIIQCYSARIGDLSATLTFSADLSQTDDSQTIRKWRFSEGADGWNAMNQCRITTGGEQLTVKSFGDDPFFGTAVQADEGEFQVRIRAQSDKEGILQLFWWTKDKPQADGRRRVNVPITSTANTTYEINIKVAGELAGLRIDPNIKPATLVVDWIDLIRMDATIDKSQSVELDFESKPAIPVKLSIQDKPGLPVVAAFEIRDSYGRSYPEQTKRLAPDLFFQSQVYRTDGQTISLPPGTYTVKCWRGPHSLPQVKQIVVKDQPVDADFAITRWIDPTELGWWSGDHHIHAAGCLHYVNPTEGILPKQMLLQTMGEDMNIGCCLTWGPCFDYQKQFFTGSVDDVSQYPYLIRYDVEVSGFGSHQSGHLNLLRLNEQIYPGGDSKHHWPTLGLNTLRWAKRQGAVCGPAHSANGLNNYIGRLGDYQDGPKGLPHFNLPRMDGIGACEYVVDITHEVEGPDGKPVPAVDFISTMDTSRVDELNMWYHTLNCGYRVRASGETDFPCISGQRVGMGRVYVKVPGKLTFEDWILGIREGRSYISDGTGHLMDFEASLDGGKSYLPVGGDNSEIASDAGLTMNCRAKCAVRLAPDRNGNFPQAEVELIVNGLPVETKIIPGDGSRHDLQFETKIDSSSWVALRTFPNAHTNPFFVEIGDKPIRPSQASVQWMQACTEQCWKVKQRTYAANEMQDARQAYQHARETYQAMLDEFNTAGE